MEAVDNSRIARNTIFLYVRTFVTMAIGLYTSRRILEVLGVVDFGVYNIVGGIIVMMTFLSSSLNVAISRYLTLELGRKDYERFNRVFNMALPAQAILAVVLVVIAETLGLWFVNTQLVIPPERMGAANWVYQASVVTTVVAMMNAPFVATNTINERMHVYAYAGLGESIAKLLIVISLIWCPWDKLVIWAIALMAVSVLSAVGQAAYCLHQFPYCRIRWHWDRRLFRSMTAFSGWNLLGQLAWTLRDHGTNIILNIFGGPIANAARGVSIQVKGAVMGLASGFQGAMNPQLTKSYAAGDIDETHRLLTKSSKFTFYLLLLPAIPVCFEITYLLGIWLVDVPAYATLFTVLVIIEGLCEVFTGPIVNVLVMTGKIKWYQIVVGALMLLNVPTAYVLMRFGLPLWVPFVVSIAFVFICQGARLYFCRRLAQLPVRKYLVRVVLRCAIVSLVSLIVPTVISLVMADGFTRLVVLTLASLVSTGLSVWCLGMNRSERHFVADYLRERFHRKKK